jgi:putative ABC transport system ATP-binding protein
MGAETIHALREVSLEIQRGEYVAIMGPSGSGKSTLMNLIGCLDTPTAGEYELNGVQVSQMDDNQLAEIRNKEIGFIFQTFNLLPMLTARENMVLPLTIAGRKVDEEWLEKLIATVGLGDRLNHRPAELSGGQQQRVAVARALVTRPAVLFADEPTGNLDSKTSDEVLELLRNSADEFGQTIVMVTHDAHAATSADRVVFLLDGRVALDCGKMSRDEIYEVVKSLEAKSTNGGSAGSATASSRSTAVQS